jgi:hypothetical protein
MFREAVFPGNLSILFSEITGRKFFARQVLSPYERRFLGTAGLTSWKNAV